MATFANPVNTQTVGPALVNICAQVGEQYKWWKTALAQLNAGVGTAALLTAAGITDAGQQQQITETMQMLAGLVAFAEGTETALNTTNYPMGLIAEMRGMQF